MDNIPIATNSRPTRSNSTSDSSTNKTNDKLDPSKTPNSIDKVCVMLSKLQQTVEKNSKTSNDKFSVLENKLTSQTDLWKTEMNKILSNHLNKCDTNYNSLASKVNIVEKTVSDHLELIERKNRLNEILIRGIPEKEKENLYGLYNKLAKAVKFPYEMAYVLSRIFRLKHKSSTESSSKNQAPPILLKFVTPYLKQSFFKQYWKFKHLKLSDIGFDSADRIFLSDNLTKKNSILYKKAADLKSSNMVEKIHVRNGLVQVKYSGSSKFKLIMCENDLLVDTNPEIISSKPQTSMVDLNKTVVENEIY